MLQSGLHKQHMKDLFVELCLTVPVRLSSLLPYLPMLMDPLVSALNGSQTLVSQGLRTLELCVDNLQPDFLYDHIQPVRAELMQVGYSLYFYCKICFSNILGKQFTQQIYLTNIKCLHILVQPFSNCGTRAPFGGTLKNHLIIYSIKKKNI